jgi:hypothetical protein
MGNFRIKRCKHAHVAFATNRRQHASRQYNHHMLISHSSQTQTKTRWQTTTSTCSRRLCRECKRRHASRRPNHLMLTSLDTHVDDNSTTGTCLVCTETAITRLTNNHAAHTCVAASLASFASPCWSPGSKIKSCTPWATRGDTGLNPKA